MAFPVARCLLHDNIQAGFGNALAPINEGVRKARLVPSLPAILVAADADNSGGRSIGWIDALRLEPVPRP